MENSGGWKTYRKFREKPLPKNVFGPFFAFERFPLLFQGGFRGSKTESGKGGWKTQGGGKTYRKFGLKPLPKNVFGPPAYDTFPPPPPFFGRLSVISFKKKEAPTRATPISELQKWFWRAHSAVRFPPPPPIHAIRFAHPLSRCPKLIRPTLHLHFSIF